MRRSGSAIEVSRVDPTDQYMQRTEDHRENEIEWTRTVVSAGEGEPLVGLSSAIVEEGLSTDGSFYTNPARVMLLSRTAAGYELIAVHPADGAELWRVQYATGVPVRAVQMDALSRDRTRAVSRLVVYVDSEEAPTLYELDPQDGRLVAARSFAREQFQASEPPASERLRAGCAVGRRGVVSVNELATSIRDRSQDLECVSVLDGDHAIGVLYANHRKEATAFRVNLRTGEPEWEVDTTQIWFGLQPRTGLEGNDVRVYPRAAGGVVVYGQGMRGRYVAVLDREGLVTTRIWGDAAEP